MIPRVYSNTAVTTALAAAIGAGDGSLVVNSATGYPAAPFAIAVDVGSVASEEVMLVTAKSGTTFTVTRGYDGTTAVAHAIGAPVIHAAIADDFRGMQLGTRDVSSSAPSSGDGLLWNGSAWAPGDVLNQSEGDARYARLAAANTFSLGQTLHGHSAIGASAAIDSAYPGGSPWPRVLALDDGTVTNLSGAGFYSLLGAYQYFNASAAVGKSIFLLSLEAELQGAQNYQSIEGIFGGAYHAGSGTASYVAGLEFYALATGTGAANSLVALNVIAANRTSVPKTSATIWAGAFQPEVASGNTGTTVAGVITFPVIASGATATTLHGIHIDTASINAGATIGTHYGLRIGPVTVGTTRYAIHTSTGPVRLGDYIEMPEIGDPAAPSTNTGRLYVRDNGAGKSQLVIRFPAGAIQVIATEP